MPYDHFIGLFRGIHQTPSYYHSYLGNISYQLILISPSNRLACCPIF
ncbi:hypothetical protein XIS1_940011 [Xenorhabdus innexi]|uniref:Uncharacterized protein n=1 Tax=Xenorhabdus innexi TaxID=290109 RepID=A0A1N6N254_9GAMM|nr:hypothetical protein XIS1_940011 [Xenorhabdus innexi]